MYGRCRQRDRPVSCPTADATVSFVPWWRTFRYIQVVVETSDEALTISDIRAAFTAYPFQLRATFQSSDPTLQRIFDVGWRTARLGAFETYMDTPYWEQLQYVGDTRIQALVVVVPLVRSLVKNAIVLFDGHSFVGPHAKPLPGALPQFIPPFSLFWIGSCTPWWYSGTVISKCTSGPPRVLQGSKRAVAAGLSANGNGGISWPGFDVFE